MVPLDYILAVALLTSGPEAGDMPPPADGVASVRPTLQTLAVSWEVLDPREMRYVLTRPEDFAADLKLLRRRHRELADAPPLQAACGSPTGR